jgi:hypothetical protein
MVATIFAFKKGKAETYRRTEGIIFTVNGQTHGYLTAEFFRRAKVGMSYLADSLLVIVDCTGISGRGRELLFMNSRDRLRDGEQRKAVEEQLEDVLRSHPGLRSLRERRRREEIESRIEDSKPLEQILESLLQHSPTLANLFQFGNRASNPFKTTTSGAKEKPYEGKQYPTYFKLKGREPGSELHREGHLNARSRVAFETDAVNDYFRRSIDPGKFTLWLVTESGRAEAKDRGFSDNMNPYNGIANLSIRFPVDCKVGDQFQFVAEITDATQIEPFINRFSIVIHEEVAPKPGSRSGERQRPPGNGGDKREIAGGIELPVCKPVPKDEWHKQSPPFDQYTALVVKDSGVTASDPTSAHSPKVIYDFFINIDNVHLQRYLKTELKLGEDNRVVRKRFELGMMLCGLALIHQRRLDDTIPFRSDLDVNVSTESIDGTVAAVTKAFAPFLLPMIDALGALGEEQIAASATSGDAT